MSLAESRPYSQAIGKAHVSCWLASSRSKSLRVVLDLAGDRPYSARRIHNGTSKDHGGSSRIPTRAIGGTFWEKLLMDQIHLTILLNWSMPSTFPPGLSYLQLMSMLHIDFPLLGPQCAWYFFGCIWVSRLQLSLVWLGIVSPYNTQNLFPSLSIQNWSNKPCGVLVDFTRRCHSFCFLTNVDVLIYMQMTRIYYISCENPW